MTETQWRRFRDAFPAIAMGEHDAHYGLWRDIPGWRESFAYEIGRMLIQTPPKIVPPGVVIVASDITRAINQLVVFVE